MAVRADILAWAVDFCRGTPDGTEEENLFGAFRLAGDDCSEFLDEFAELFGVDMSDFRSEFHYDASEPPHMFRRVLPVGLDEKVIPYHPIRLNDLVDAAENGRWDYTYPDHTIKISWWHRAWFPTALAVIVVLVSMLLSH